jgi:DNA modification methylase
MQLGWSEIWANDRSDLSRAEARALVAADNEIAKRAEPDQDDLSQLVAAVHAEDESLAVLAAGGEDELRRLLEMAGEEPVGAPEAQIDKGQALAEKYGTALGQIWQLGRHRLAVGDCRDKALVDALIQGERSCQAIITDPPFGVRDDAWDKFGGESGFLDFTAQWLEIGREIADVVICFMADRNIPLLLAAAVRANLPYRRALIWRKPPGSQFAGASLDGFWFDFEIIEVFGRPQFKPEKYTKMAVLEYRTVGAQEHGCEKPVELLEDLVRGYTLEGGVVIDLFGGVGTTLLACQKLHRQCRIIEKEATFAAIIIQRWIDLTGEEPVLLN